MLRFKRFEHLCQGRQESARNRQSSNQKVIGGCLSDISDGVTFFRFQFWRIFFDFFGRRPTGDLSTVERSGLEGLDLGDEADAFGPAFSKEDPSSDPDELGISDEAELDGRSLVALDSFVLQTKQNVLESCFVGSS